MTCQYHFTLEYYHTLTKACYDCPYNKTDCSKPHCVAADGNLRPILTANRMFPGPAIQVCFNDTVVVDVSNRLENGEGTSIHWHGVQVSPYMDGAGMITQCRIPSTSSFQYKFQATTPGTHYWHSHSGLQNADGLFGAFIINEPQEMDVHHNLYDVDAPEYTVIFHDWMTELTVTRLVNMFHRDFEASLFPSLMLINGKGVHRAFEKGNETAYTPYEIFNVQKDRRYRFRLIGNNLNPCTILFSIDNHNLTVISSDGVPVEPYTVQALYFVSGERYDVILNTNQAIDNYWMKVTGDMLCAPKQCHQEAIVRYEGASHTEPTKPHNWDLRVDGIVLNPSNRKGDELPYVTELVSKAQNDEALKPVPDKVVYLENDFNVIDSLRMHHLDYYSIYTVHPQYQAIIQQVNHISTILPPAPIQSQYGDIPSALFCNEDTVSNCSKEYCSCLHLIKIPLGDVVEFIMVDEGTIIDAIHPFHLHGNYFRVIGMDKLNTSTTMQHVKSLDSNGMLHRNLDKAPLKDSVQIPDGGYAIIRLHANIPGFWFFHCHWTFDTEIGMGLILQVGELNQQPKIPRNFPKCGPWKFEGYEEENKGQTTVGPTDGVSRFYSSAFNYILTLCFVVHINFDR